MSYDVHFIMRLNCGKKLYKHTVYKMQGYYKNNNLLTKEYVHCSTIYEPLFLTGHWVIKPAGQGLRYTLKAVLP